MATSKELLKAIDQGARIETNQGQEVKYSPRRPGDRLPWSLQEGRNWYRYAAANCVAVFPPAEVAEPVQETAEGNFPKAVAVAIEKRNAGGDEACGCTNRGSAEGEHASDCIAGLSETAPVAVITPAVKASITPEVIEALRELRGVTASDWSRLDAFDVLDNAGIFAAIDEATGYDVDPEPERVSKCTCPGVHAPLGIHDRGCPGDPAEWGDMAYTTAPVRRACPNQGCTGEFAVNRDGSLRAHTNDNCEPCGQGVTATAARNVQLTEEHNAKLEAERKARRELLRGRINLKF